MLDKKSVELNENECSLSSIVVMVQVYWIVQLGTNVDKIHLVADNNSLQEGMCA